MSDRPRGLRLAVYTFIGVFLSILAVGACAAPVLLGFAERIYIDLVNDVNERQARSMAAFLESRLESGLSEQEAIQEFQVATMGNDVDRGYVCLIQRADVRYLSHPSPDQLGMDVKPGAVFSRDDKSAAEPWNGLLRRGDQATGHLSYGPQMAQEMVYFTPVVGTGWTVSTHENLARIDRELARLRRWLLVGSLLLSLLVAVPASGAARVVGRRREGQLEREAELERRLFEEEDARKSLELDQARELQLSLLPTELPRRADFECAARMETATEVGGDYYDVIEREDGSLMIAIGDATGHGLKAGMMVVAIKSLLAYAAEEDDLVRVSRQMARALRTMRLDRLHMALALIRLRGSSLEAVGAGMPPALIHRSASGTIEELPLSGAPLGSPIDFPYQLSRTELGAGDTVLLMSDGLPELRTSGGELGYEGVVRLFERALEGRARPQAVVTALSAAVAEATGELLDDVTFVVLRVAD